MTSYFFANGLVKHEYPIETRLVKPKLDSRDPTEICLQSLTLTFKSVPFQTECVLSCSLLKSDIRHPDGSFSRQAIPLALFSINPSQLSYTFHPPVLWHEINEKRFDRVGFRLSKIDNSQFEGDINMSVLVFAQ